MIKFQHIEADGSVTRIRQPLMCEFGIVEGLGAMISSFLVTDLGVGTAPPESLGKSVPVP